MSTVIAKPRRDQYYQGTNFDKKSPAAKQEKKAIRSQINKD